MEMLLLTFIFIHAIWKIQTFHYFLANQSERSFDLNQLKRITCISHTIYFFFTRSVIQSSFLLY